MQFWLIIEVPGWNQQNIAIHNLTLGQNLWRETYPYLDEDADINIS